MNNQQTKKAITQPQFPHFLPEISDRLQRVSDTYQESFDVHTAFTYLIAELFETTDEDHFIFTDGPKDGGIDFIIRDSPIYTIGQCKCPNLDGLNSLNRPPVFDQSPLEELLSAISMLKDRAGEYDVKMEIKRLRGDYQRDLTTVPEEVHLTAILAILGELSDQARKAFNSAKAMLVEQNIHLKLVEWNDIYSTMHALELPSDVSFNIRINYDNSEGLLVHDNYCYLLANAFDFYEAFKDYGWALFDWNVRFQLHKSPINKRIVGTLQTARGRKWFHHYNNGLLITCKSYTNDRTRERLTLTGPQIINGCQTVRSICEAYETLTPVEQEEFRERTRVQVKIIRTTDLDFIGELVVSTNDQNPMKSRNLKSNSSEQRDIQRSFRSLPKSWFYQRKDGEFQSLASSIGNAPSFRKSEYATGHKKYRVIDNEDLARVWYSFTGNAEKALRGGLDFFADGEDGLYNLVFRSIPTPAFWSAFKEPTFNSEPLFFDSGMPTPHQYLLAYSVAKYVDGRRISYNKNRDNAISRGIKNGRLRGDPDTGMPRSSPREIDEYLGEDIDYYINIMLNNSRDIMIELYSFIFCQKYSACDGLTSQKILTIFPEESTYLESGLDDISIISPDQNGHCVLGPIYGFLVDCMRQYYFEYQAEIKAAPRLKSYLAQRATVNRLRGVVLRRNSVIAQYDAPWKIPGKTFFESLPIL